VKSPDEFKNFIGKDIRLIRNNEKRRPGERSAGVLYGKNTMNGKTLLLTTWL
jgi:hypothetical protein